MADQDKFSPDELANLVKMLKDGAPAGPQAPPAPAPPAVPAEAPSLPLPPPLPAKPVAAALPVPPPAVPAEEPISPLPPPLPAKPAAAVHAAVPVPPPATPEEIPAPPSHEAPPSPADIHGSQEPIPRTPEMLMAEDLAKQFEVCRAHMEQVLTPFIGEKVARKMFAWSLDRASKKHPVLKNVHWSMSGDLLDNGAIDAERLLRNFEHFPGVDTVGLVKAALSELLAMRLGAIEQGLGASMRSAMEKDVLRLEEILK